MRRFSCCRCCDRPDVGPDALEGAVNVGLHWGSIEDARSFCVAFFDQSDHVHRHAGIGLHTPASVHFGTAPEVRSQRAATLDVAYAANPARFRHRRPTPPKLPTIAWINEPSPEALIKSA